jgi:hypothetical protein
MLRAAGLDIARARSVDEEKVFLLIGAPFTRLCEVADLLNLSHAVKQSHGGGHRKFETDKLEMFKSMGDVEKGEPFFSSLRRQAMIRTLFEIPARTGGCQLNLAKLKKAGVLCDYYPLHQVLSLCSFGPLSSASHLRLTPTPHTNATAAPQGRQAGGASG